MSLWTKRHPLPDANIYTGIYSEVASIVFDEKIWIVCDVKVKNCFLCKTHVFVYRETLLFTKKDCTNPGNWHDRIECLAADEKNLYMWRSPWFGRQKDFHLFKLDKATLIWENVLTINRRGYFTSIVIINQIMHILEVDEHPTNEVYLIRIDLQKREVVNIKTLLSTRGRRWSGYLSFHNNKLFLIEAKRNVRNVYMIQNDELKEIAHEEDTNESIQFFDENVSVFSDRTFKVHNFDFDTLSWVSEVNNPIWIKDHGDSCTIQSCVKLDGSIYLLLRLQRPKGTKFRLEFHQLDLHPTLSSICLADLTNRLFRKKAAQKLEEAKEQLPPRLESQLEKLVEWKTSAKRK